MLISMHPLTVNGCGRSTVQIQNTGFSSAIIAEDTSTSTVTSEAYFTSLVVESKDDVSEQI